ncbi:MAG: hypothetical protein H8D22_12300 [Candidatus Cloacimonetes bacterium]|nr:hypothetical protein [Candidatus Cloacimonadota bacterium]
MQKRDFKRIKSVLNLTTLKTIYEDKDVREVILDVDDFLKMINLLEDFVITEAVKKRLSKNEEYIAEEEFWHQINTK